jgi:uncharacterized membrane protein HdeD (DUF308 family)
MIDSIGQAVTASVSRGWWLFVLRGVLAVLLAVLAFTSPADTLAALVLVFGVFALFDGILSIFGSVAAAGMRQPWWPLVVRGLLGIAAGVFALVRPDMTALVLVYLVAFWAILGGATELVAAFELHDLVPHAWLLGLAGAAAIVFGVLVIASPSAGALALVWILGVFAAVYGIAYLAFGFRLLGVYRQAAPSRQPAAPPRSTAAAA